MEVQEKPMKFSCSNFSHKGLYSHFLPDASKAKVLSLRFWTNQNERFI